MKIGTKLHLALALLPVLALAPACKSTGADKADATVQGLSRLETDLAEAGNRIETTNAALDTLIADPQGDLRPAYDAYVAALSKLESSANSVKRQGELVRSRAASYYANWEQSIATITNEDIKRRSEERRAEMLEAQAEADAWILSFGQRFDAYVSELRDLKAFLGSDLNSAGVKAISGQVKKTTKSGAELRKDLDKLLSTLAEVRKATSARGPAAPAEQ